MMLFYFKKNFEQTVKKCLLVSTNLYHSIRTIEKELALVIKSLNTFNTITGMLDYKKNKF